MFGKKNVNTQEETIVQQNNEEQLLSTHEDNSFENENNMDAPTDESLFEVDSIEQVTSNNESTISSEEEHTPKLFSDGVSSVEKDVLSSETDQKLFDEENNQEKDFEIPAFLRRQKF